MSGQDLGAMRRLMVASQLRPNKVNDFAVLAAMELLPRERFVGDGQAALCYRDTVVPLGGGRGLNPPNVTGRLLDRAQIGRGDRVLLIGAATGYTAALMAELGAHVTALEEDPALLARAAHALDGVAAVTLVSGPLASGWTASAPYDVLFVDGGIDHVPAALIEQLVEDGRFVGAIVRQGLSQLVSGRRAGAHLGLTDFGDSEVAALPGFAPEPAFTF